MEEIASQDWGQVLDKGTTNEKVDMLHHILGNLLKRHLGEQPKILGFVIGFTKGEQKIDWKC